jgi:hypothetical protein
MYMDLEKLQIIKRDVRTLRTYLFSNNNENDWMKLIIIYNIYIMISHMYILYTFADYFMYSKKTFQEDFKKIFILFFILCNAQNTYRYFILNVSKVNTQLADSLYKNTKEYFI